MAAGHGVLPGSFTVRRFAGSGAMLEQELDAV